ncbi:MAG: T9SS type A sorting domain-containing protein, partial [Paludibacter sp.]
LQTSSVTAYPNFSKIGIWYNLLTGAELNVTNTQMTITMQAGELLIYTDRKVNLPNGLKETQIQSDCTVFPTKTNGMVYISTASTVKNVNVYNMQGMIVKTVTNTTEIDLSSATNGLYILEVNTLKGKSQYKIVKE